ncbi:MAG TPA: hypothetical protein VF158_05420 [Longimicrobiales bacterium]
MNVDFRTVAATYHFRHPDDYSPTGEELDAWSRYLDKIYGPYLDAALEDAGLPADDAGLRAELVLLAELSNGAHPQARLEAACRYYLALADARRAIV